MMSNTYEDVLQHNNTRITFVAIHVYNFYVYDLYVYMLCIYICSGQECVYYHVVHQLSISPSLPAFLIPVSLSV